MSQVLENNGIDNLKQTKSMEIVTKYPYRLYLTSQVSNGGLSYLIYFQNGGSCTLEFYFHFRF